jgi:acyl-CoA reductase-like NAD-dependent aldehyde dehydrogenase
VTAAAKAAWATRRSWPTRTSQEQRARILRPIVRPAGQREQTFVVVVMVVMVKMGVMVVMGMSATRRS